MMTLESRLLDVNFSEISRQITIKDKRIGKVWKQTPFHDRKVRMDQSRFSSFKSTFVASYQKILPWVQQVCLDEMVEHCFLSEDHLIQRSSFSSGKSVVVNFSDCNHAWDGHIIPARDYLILS